MTEYRKIEYRIDKNGKITERVLNATGQNCTETTKNIEKALGNVESQELLPEYYQEDSNLIDIQRQNLDRL